MECSAKELVAGHIYRQQWPKSLLAKVGVTLHDPSNIIIMQSQLEKAFDKWQWIVLPDGPDDYKVHQQQQINYNIKRGAVQHAPVALFVLCCLASFQFMQQFMQQVHL
ncbi:hypothetical protein OEZ85_003663 [Tetradesmus obliquus]|uniref:HNH nuclease domain-containing protein n=1 Tax=Tetradesmus obliquus TaxID=3088 RepID=A0ABY8UC04_TETOB|nr:hypothetical protein OEZ85_003663 [Tetradesmus obliquus]